MNALFLILTVLIIIAAILLVAAVLLQNSKGDGMASNFIAGNQTLGVRQTADLLEKVTWVLVSFILAVSIITAFTTGSNGTDIDITDKIENTVTNQAPEFPATPIQQSDPATPAESN